MALTDHRTQIYLSDEQYRAAVRLARERDASLAAIVREALADYLAKADPRPRAPWADDPLDSLAGLLALPPLPPGADDLVEAIDVSVYDEP